MLVRGIMAIIVLFSTAIVSVTFLIDQPDQTALESADHGYGTTPLAKAPASLPVLLPKSLHTAPIGKPPTPSLISQVLRARPGDTLAGMLTRAGIGRGEAVAAIDALRKYYNPRLIRPGNEVRMEFSPEPEASGPANSNSGRLQALSISPAFNRQVIVARAIDGTFSASEKEKPLTRKLVRADGTIKHSLYIDGLRAGLSAPILIALIRAYSWDVDFQRGVHPGDGFEVMFERLHETDGPAFFNGDIVYAALTLQGVRHAMYRHELANGDIDYFDEKGRSAKKALMRTPIDGARLSSGFGRRKHPILGYTKMHRGLDFAAPRGTPIYAAGSGTIEHAGRNGAYGKYIRIRHNGTYKTAYAHMRRLVRGMRKGKRVRQGQIIGYVGSTGRSTGPHLHYEILRGGRQVNPRRLKMPSGRKLNGSELARFQFARALIERDFAALKPRDDLADAK
jgi:murein DD-endopeptidase MepM/ murein hydrolase activator NlpD